jgi:hypothetical protein
MKKKNNETNELDKEFCSLFTTEEKYQLMAEKFFEIYNEEQRKKELSMEKIEYDFLAKRVKELENKHPELWS